MSMQLGFIPSWQFDMNPANNPHLNPFLKMPPGIYQTTRQPVGPYMTGMNGAALGGIGDVITNLGTIFVVGLAAFGGYTVYKRIRGGKKSTAK